MARLFVDLEPLDIEALTARASTREGYSAFCAANPDLRIERTAAGEIIIMPPVYPRTSAQNAEIVMQLKIWARQDGRGLSFGPDAGFDLPNGANRGPDAAWVPKSRLQALAPEDRNAFFPFCPDFVVELRSTSDRLPTLKEKMQEYIENGARLGWLIDPLKRKVYVYRPGSEVVELDNPSTISADPELPGFVLNLDPVWDPGF